MEDKYLTAGDISKMFSLSRAAVYRMAREGRLPKGIRIGTARRWSLNALNEFLKEAVNA